MKAEYTFEIYRAKGGTRIRVRHKNGEIVLTGELYRNKKDAESMLSNFIKAIQSDDFDKLDAVHGRTTTKIPPDVSEDPEAEVVDSPQGKF